MKTCPTCNNEYSRIATHYASNESHRPNLNDKGKDVMRFLLLEDAEVIDDHSHNALRIYTTDVEFAEKTADILGPFCSTKRVHQTAEGKVESMIKNGINPQNIDVEDYDPTYVVRTIPVPYLDQFGGADDIEELTPRVLGWFIGRHATLNGLPGLPTLWLNTAHSGISTTRLRQLLFEHNVRVGREAVDDDGGTFFVPSHHDYTVAVPYEGINQIINNFGVDVHELADNKCPHIFTE